MTFFFKRQMLWLMTILTINLCYSQDGSSSDMGSDKKGKSVKKKNKKKVKLPEIDLSKWKVTIPVGKPTEVAPPEILDYANNEVLKPYMYNDSARGALGHFLREAP